MGDLGGRYCASQERELVHARHGRSPLLVSMTIALHAAISENYLHLKRARRAGARDKGPRSHVSLGALPFQDVVGNATDGSNASGLLRRT